jgi:hypothetical protein
MIGAQCIDRLMPRFGLRPHAQRVVQAAAQPARTHRCGAGVEQRQQRRRCFAAQRFGQFQIAAGGGVHAQPGRIMFDRQRRHVRQRALLRGLGVAEQCTAGGQCDRHLGHVEGREVAAAEVFAQQARRFGCVELPGAARRDRPAAFRRQHTVGHQQFRRTQSVEQRRQYVQCDFGQLQFAAGQIEPGDAGACALDVQRHQQ